MFGMDTYTKFLQDAGAAETLLGQGQDEWMEYPLFRELWLSNNSLFNVMLNNSTPLSRTTGTTYYLVVPPKEGSPGCLRRKATTGRIGQLEVKGHVIVQQRPTMGNGESMSDEARVEIVPPPPHLFSSEHAVEDECGSPQLNPPRAQASAINRSPSRNVVFADDDDQRDSVRRSERGSTISPQAQGIDNVLHRSRSSVRVRGQSMVMPTGAAVVPTVGPGWTLKVIRRGNSALGGQAVPIEATVVNVDSISSKDGAHVVYLLFVDQPFTIQPPEIGGGTDADNKTPGSKRMNASFNAASPSATLASTGMGGHPWYKALYQPTSRGGGVADEVMGITDVAMWIPDDAARFREDILTLGAPNHLPIEKLDPIMGNLDAELQMFVSAYDCVRGFETFMIARVNQIAETAIEDYLEAMICSKKAAMQVQVSSSSARLLQAQADVMMAGGDPNHTLAGLDSTPSSIRTDRNSSAPGSTRKLDGSLEDDVASASYNSDYPSSDDGTVIDDDLHEYAVVAFHSIVTNTVAPRLQTHWQELHYNEDFAFYYACQKLAAHYTEAQCAKDAGLSEDFFSLEGSNKEMAHEETTTTASLASTTTSNAMEILAEPILIIGQLANPLGVLSILRILEAAISSIVRVVASRCQGRFEVTADVCIPLTVFTLSRSQPQTLPSTLKFLWNFMLDAYETSSLCYALTTFEASMTQLLHEYSEYVRSR